MCSQKKYKETCIDIGVRLDRKVAGQLRHMDMATCMYTHTYEYIHYICIIHTHIWSRDNFDIWTWQPAYTHTHTRSELASTLEWKHH
jgi:hypothetical protein